jgi:hypothetical protein
MGHIQALAAAMKARHLYRLARREPDGTYTQVGRAYLSRHKAAKGTTRQNEARREFNLPPITHITSYTQTRLIEHRATRRG